MAKTEPSLKDIAAAAGVHAMTVSRALRNTGRMRAATRQRVVEAAQKLGYRPHAAATAMRTGHSGCIVLVSDPLQPALRLGDETLGGMVETAEAHGAYLALARFPVSRAGVTLPAILRRRLAEGVLLNDASDQAAARIALLRGMGLPVVWFARQQSGNAGVVDEAGGAGSRATSASTRARTAPSVAQQAVERLVRLVGAGGGTVSSIAVPDDDQSATVAISPPGAPR